MSWPVYLLMVSYKRKDSAINIINQYRNALKPSSKTKMLVIENNEEPLLPNFFQFFQYSDISYFHFKNKNKACAVNYAIDNLIKEKEALIIHIDNDIKFSKDFLIRYYNAALQKGTSFYFGGSFLVNYPKNESRLLPYLNRSAVGKKDEEFLKMRRLMFLGFSYSFFKSQWEVVNGLDERFSPGSEHNLAAEESIFQKKLKYAGFKPFFVVKNVVEHCPAPEVYKFKNILLRQENNGFTHGFQNLINTGNRLKIKYLKNLLYHVKGCVIFKFKNDSNIKWEVKYAYTKGYMKALILYFKIDNKKSYLDF